jgi:microcystin-dependent protein
MRSIFGQVRGRGFQKPYIGDTKTSSVEYDHYGWLICDGRSLSKTEYPLLFDVIGYSFGGSDISFSLPDPRGRVIGYTGSGAGLTTRTAGTSVGAETETLDISEMPAHNHGGLTGISGEHTHDVSDLGHTHTYTVVATDDGNFSNVNGQHPTGDASPTNDPNITYTGTSYTEISLNSAGNHTHTIYSQGGGVPFSNMQPTLFFGNLFIYSGKRHTGVLSNTGGRAIY